MKGERDHSLDNLLDLDGQTFFIDPKHYVRFVVREVEPTPERPQGLNYSLTLHDENGERLVGFDNAHSVQTTKGPGGKKRRKHDHRHRLRSIRPYEYKNAETLLMDFWDAVDAVLKERGVRP